MSVDLQKKTRWSDREERYFHTFLAVREREMEKSSRFNLKATEAASPG